MIVYDRESVLKGKTWDLIVNFVIRSQKSVWPFHPNLPWLACLAVTCLALGQWDWDRGQVWQGVDGKVGNERSKTQFQANSGSQSVYRGPTAVTVVREGGREAGEELLDHVLSKGHGTVAQGAILVFVIEPEHGGVHLLVFYITERVQLPKCTRPPPEDVEWSDFLWRTWARVWNAPFHIPNNGSVDFYLQEGDAPHQLAEAAS